MWRGRRGCPGRPCPTSSAVGDGWAPLGIPPEQLVAELSKLKKMCGEAGRDFNKIEITMYAPVLQSGDVKRTIAAYEEAGVHRLILLPRGNDQASILTQVSEVGRNLIGKV